MNSRTSQDVKTVGAAVGAVLSAGGSLACCLPVGFLGALGTAGASVFFVAARPWLLLVSVALIGVGGYQAYRSARCGVRQSKASLFLLATAFTLVVLMTLMPQVFASLIANFLGGEP